MIEKFDNVHEFLKVKLEELVTKGTTVKSTNYDKDGKYTGNSGGNEIVELGHQFFGIKDPTKTIFNFKNYKTREWWMVGEILTEFLNINPPIMSKYRADIIEKSYKLTAQGTCEYLYGTRWSQWNQIENVRKKLADNPNSKKAIIQTWFLDDSAPNKKDSPCNIHYMFLNRDNKLDMTATIRSNDIMRGCKYDYFLASFMQQSLASWINLDIGELYFHVNSLHFYKNDLETITNFLKNPEEKDIISLKIPKGLDVRDYWNDLRHIKKVEEATYNQAFDYADKNINDISINLFKDFARIFAIKNAKHYKIEKLVNKYKNEIESEEIKKWLK